MKAIKMSNKTAMQELLEWTRKTLPMDLDTPRMIEAKIESLIPKEKDQIKIAYIDGCIGEMYELSVTYTSEEYYKVTYGK